MNSENYKVIGYSFEDLNLSDMSKIQGGDDVSPEASPVVATTIATAGETTVALGGAASGALGAGSAAIGIAKTAKGKC